METRPRFKVLSERPEKRGIDLAIPELIVYRVIHYTIAAPQASRTHDLPATFFTITELSRSNHSPKAPFKKK